jgi:hypothetical protein
MMQYLQAGVRRREESAVPAETIEHGVFGLRNPALRRRESSAANREQAWGEDLVDTIGKTTQSGTVVTTRFSRLASQCNWTGSQVPTVG